MANLKIGKETLKKMILQLTTEGWVNTCDEIVPVGHGDNEAAKEVLKKGPKEGVEIAMQHKGKAQAALPRPLAARPCPKRSSSQGKPLPRTA